MRQTTSEQTGRDGGDPNTAARGRLAPRRRALYAISRRPGGGKKKKKDLKKCSANAAEIPTPHLIAIPSKIKRTKNSLGAAETFAFLRQRGFKLDKTNGMKFGALGR